MVTLLVPGTRPQGQGHGVDAGSRAGTEARGQIILGGRGMERLRPGPFPFSIAYMHTG